MKLTAAEKHQLRIARQTVQMSPQMAAAMGGMSRDEAYQILIKLGRKLAEKEAQ